MKSIAILSLLIPKLYAFIHTTSTRFNHATTFMSPSANGESKKLLPKAIIFDLDGCLWTPEMYQILDYMGGRGAPFKRDPHDPLNLLTCANEPVKLLGDVRSVFSTIYTEAEFEDILIGISSRTDEPDWARELLSKFKVPLGDGSDKRDHVYLEQVINGPIEIAYDSKVDHFARIADKCNIGFDEMLFFDNEYGNCRSVAKLGVSVVYCPDGVTRDLWKMGFHEEFPRSDGTVINGDQRGW